MKTVGIIGGLGPDTTAKFYLEIINTCFKKNQQARPPILIWNVPIPFIVEEDLIIKGQGEERFLPFLIDGAKRLERAGADFLVIPCNSVHIFIEEIRKAVNIPVLSIVEETVKILKKQKVAETGILSTGSTLDKGLFQKALSAQNIKFRVPISDEQLKLNSAIHKIVLNSHTDKERKDVFDIIQSLTDQNIKNLILACTDLHLVVHKKMGVNILDTMKILADATVKEILT